MIDALHNLIEKRESPPLAWVPHCTSTLEGQSKNDMEFSMVARRPLIATADLLLPLGQDLSPRIVLRKKGSTELAGLTILRRQLEDGLLG